MESLERAVVDSEFFQRLRHIHQLSLSHLIYPGATHKRFEHCLGVMELASRVYDVITDPDNVSEQIRRFDFVVMKGNEHWHHFRTTLRMAALCHDLGHLPFSHGPEELLPEDEKGKWNHERLSYEIITSDELKPLFKKLHVDPEVVAKLAIGEKDCKKLPQKIEFDLWESILSEIITGNALGVDRMDYLLRDSHHAGVAYGKFDHYRLIDTIRILPKEEGSDTPFLGINAGGLPSAEQMLLARYFMFTQVYLHPVRRVYDMHLMDFLAKSLKDGKFATDIQTHKKMTDNEVLAAIAIAYWDENQKAHEEAKILTNRKHFKLLWERNVVDREKNVDAIDCIYKAAAEKFGKEKIRKDSYEKKKKEKGAQAFPVQLDDGRIADAFAVSETLEHIPTDHVEFLFVSRDCAAEAMNWLAKERDNVIHPLGCKCKGEGNG